jgi:hypothetical protein
MAAPAYIQTATRDPMAVRLNTFFLAHQQEKLKGLISAVIILLKSTHYHNILIIIIQ